MKIDFVLEQKYWAMKFQKEIWKIDEEWIVEKQDKEDFRKFG